MKNILFLSVDMRMGYGVSVVINNLSILLKKRGFRPVVCCLRCDGFYNGYEIKLINGDWNKENLFPQVYKIASELESPVIVAHSSPFFEILRDLQNHFSCWAWEHGDPTPIFFPKESSTERSNVILHKKLNVYPFIDGVITISNFIRHDIDYPDGRIIYNGCDNVPNLGPKTDQDFSITRKKPLIIGTLMRLGKGEALYKGNHLYTDLIDQLKKNNISVQPSIMGAGDKKIADNFIKKGINAFVGATDKEKYNYLRNCDIFISCSLWEGFNLPLVEAQALGTLGIAFDTGAHPEVTPFVISSIEELITFIKEMSQNISLLKTHSLASYKYVRNKFRWNDAVDRFLFYTLGQQYVFFENTEYSSGKGKLRYDILPRIIWLYKQGVASLKKNGPLVTMKKLLNYLYNKSKSALYWLSK